MERQPVQPGYDREVEELLESSWSKRGRALEGRELRLELAVTAAFLVAVAALLLVAPTAPQLDPVAIAVVVAYAIAASAAFPVGAGLAAPTQLFLVPLFALASAQLVPVLVLAGLALSTLGSVVTRRATADRLVACGGDAVHALGPALVLVIFAGGDAHQAGPTVIALAFAAQLGFDFGSSYLRDLIVLRVRPELHARVLAQVWGVDLALLPFGLLTAVESTKVGWAALAPLPLVVVLRALAADRSRRIAAAHDRLRALEHERRRHQSAVERIGDALASRLDLGSLIDVVTHVATEALDGEVGRGGVFAASALSPAPSTVVGEPGHRAAALGDAERSARASSQLGEAESGGVHAVASPIGGPREPIAMVAVARSRPYSNGERAVLAQLCQQAAVSADEAVRHERLRATEARLRHQAFHDALTGLPNRALYTDRVERSLRSHAGEPRELAVLFMDLDGFKLANDTLGHEAGDELLVAIARRLEACLRDGDTAARFGGDEFAALLEGLDRGAEAETVAERIRKRLSQPISVRGREFTVHASVGLAFSAAGVDHEQLLRNADLAMYAAKQAGGNRVTSFRDEMLVRAKTRIELANDLPEAIVRGDLDLCFQPILDLGDGSIRAVEALVRWRHPSRGLLAPGDFIASAEHMGLIDKVGRFVLDEAGRLASTGLPPAAGNPQVSVNISPLQLGDVRFVTDVVDALRRHDLSPGRLIVEVTESMAIEADPETRKNLHELHALGVTLALDDFGTGYSSLSYLTQLPIDLLKLDRSFMAEVDRDPDQARLVGGVIQLAQSMGLVVVAEGIERPGQLEKALELGAGLVQGFMLVEPMGAEDLVRWLGQRGQSEWPTAPAEIDGSRSPASAEAGPYPPGLRSAPAPG